MKNLILSCFLLVYTSYTYPAVNYTSEQLHKMLEQDFFPRTHYPKLIHDSVGMKTFSECRHNFHKQLSVNSSYPFKITQDAFDYFKFSLWLNDALYDFSCVSANGRVIEEVYKSEYK